MKKLIVSACALVFGLSLFAQDSTMNNNSNSTNSNPNSTNMSTNTNSTNMSTNSTNNSTNSMSNSTNSMSNTSSNVQANNGTAPDNIRTSFQSTYPDATNVTWETVTLPVFSQYSREGVGNVKWYPAMQGYRATYIANNRVMHVYYTDKVKSYVVAGPVIESWVPEDVVTKVINQYHGNVYDITMMKNAMNLDVYQVRFTEGGNNLTTAYLNADGSAATAADIYVTK